MAPSPRTPDTTLRERTVDELLDVASLGFDPEALRERYRLERDKRLRGDGTQQYIEASGDFAHYIDDPYVEPGFTREPLLDEVDVVIVGGGISGLLVGARLRQAGIEGIRIVERGGDIGGVWYWNRYPGARCDIESYIYLPLLEELGYIPRERYSQAPEIHAHLQAIARRFDLYRDACLQTRVTELAWDERTDRWTVSTDRGDRMRARFVAMANGGFQKPKLPGIPGIETFTGHSFHTSRWDYAYTGGDHTGGLTGLADKRVGIIGTGATAVQCIPHLGASAGTLHVFQRTPSPILPREFTPTDPDWAASLEPGWQRERRDNFNTVFSGGTAEVDLVADGWTDMARNVMTLTGVRGAERLSPAELASVMEIADFVKMEELRARIDEIVHDRATAEALKPWYRLWCKRPTFHDAYLETFNRPNVHLVDTAGRGVERIDGSTVHAAGRAIEIDCLIFASGFEIGSGYVRSAGYDVIGRNGLRLSTKWSEGVRTLHGMHTHGFPNLLILGGAQASGTANMPHGFDELASHAAYVIARSLRTTGLRTVEASRSAEDAWVETIVGMSGGDRSFAEACTPGYLNNEGRVDRISAQNGGYSSAVAYFQLLAEWRKAGDMRGLVVTPVPD